MKKLVLASLLLAAARARAATPPDSIQCPAVDCSTQPMPQPAGLPWPTNSASTSQVGSTSAERPWYRPTHLILQTAGGLGMLTAGAGYTFAQSRLETDLLIGYVPKKYAGSTLITFSGKVLYSPFRLALAPKWQLLPLTAGAFFSHTHNTLNDGVKGQYAADYYWFSHDNFYGPILSSRLTYLAPPIAATGQPRKLSFYYELSTNDLYVLSYTTNTSGLGLGKILTLALGVKADF